MQKHWKAIQWFSIVFIFSLILAFVKGWFFLVYGLLLGLAVLGFVYLVAVTRFDGRPSDEDEEKQERAQRHHRTRRAS